MSSSRPLFTDGWNSLWHFIFGLIAFKYEIIIPIFILYQLYDYHDKNILIDIIEFFIGYIFNLLIFTVKIKYNYN